MNAQFLELDEPEEPDEISTEYDDDVDKDKYARKKNTTIQSQNTKQIINELNIRGHDAIKTRTRNNNLAEKQPEEQKSLNKKSTISGPSEANHEIRINSDDKQNTKVTKGNMQELPPINNKTNNKISQAFPQIRENAEVDNPTQLSQTCAVGIIFTRNPETKAFEITRKLAHLYNNEIHLRDESIIHTPLYKYISVNFEHVKKYFTSITTYYTKAALMTKSTKSVLQMFNDRAQFLVFIIFYKKIIIKMNGENIGTIKTNKKTAVDISNEITSIINKSISSENKEDLLAFKNYLGSIDLNTS